VNDVPDVTVAPEEFSTVLAELTKFSAEEKKKEVHDGIKKIAREAKKEVETKSRKSEKKYSRSTDSYVSEVDKVLRTIGSESKVTAKNKHYKDSWVTTTTEEKGNLTVTVHNRKWQLVHLLEKGHLLKDGTGRVYGEVPAYEHVESTQKNAEEKVNALLEGL